MVDLTSIERRPSNTCPFCQKPLVQQSGAKLVGERAECYVVGGVSRQSQQRARIDIYPPGLPEWPD